MRRFFLLAVGLLLVAGGYRYMTGGSSGDKSKVLIWAYVGSDAGPYTVNVKAVDMSTGETLKDEDTPVVGEYGPATLLYDAGHPVQLTVTAKLGRPLPMTSYVRLQDGGLGQPKKTCTPVTAAVTELSCSIVTKH